MYLDTVLQTAIIRELVKLPALNAIPPKRWDIVGATTLPSLSIKVTRPTMEAVWRSGIYDCDAELKIEDLATAPRVFECARLLGLCERVLLEDLEAHLKLTDDYVYCFGVWRTGGRNTTSGKHRVRILNCAVRCFETVPEGAIIDSETGEIILDSETEVPVVQSSDIPDGAVLDSETEEVVLDSETDQPVIDS